MPYLTVSHAFRRTALSAAVALVFVPLGAQAATLTADGTNCTLVNAITAANTDTATGGCAAGSGADTIVMPASSTLTLTAANNGVNGLPLVTSAITIEGNGSTIERNTANPNQFRFFEVNATGSLTLNDTTLRGGWANIAGAIFNAATLATLVLNRSTLTGNTADGGFTSGTAGALYNGGTATLLHSTVSNNRADKIGGGVYNGGTLVLLGSTVSGNQAANNDAGATNGIYGGGIVTAKALTVINSTISGNSALGDNGGGGIRAVASGTTPSVTLVNSTVTGNTATSTSGTSLGGGGVQISGGTFTISNSIVAGNTSSSTDLAGPGHEISVFSGTVTDNGYNLLGHSGASTANALRGFTSSGTGSVVATSNGTNVALGSLLNTSLAQNGAATGMPLTHALVAGSPALNAGDPAFSDATVVVGKTVGEHRRADQRRFGRINTDTRRDMGAFELNGVALPTAPTGVAVTSGANQLSVAFTAPVYNSSSGQGYPITNYAYSTDGGATFTAVIPASTTSPVVIAGLTNGTTYAVKLRAVVAESGDGNASPAVNATPAIPNAAPVASAVDIKGTDQAGQTLTGSYTYSDAESDLQGTSTFRWLRGTNAINGATASTYVLTTDDVGNSISFCVTPVASAGTTTGTEVCSSATAAVVRSPVTTVQLPQTQTPSTATDNTPRTPLTVMAGGSNGDASASTAQVLGVGQQDAPANRPARLQAPIGQTVISATASAAGATQNFSLFVAAELGVNGYWQQNAKGQWINLASPAYGGKLVKVSDTQLRLDFVIQDGGAFDTDGLTDSVVSITGVIGHFPPSVTLHKPKLPARGLAF